MTGSIAAYGFGSRHTARRSAVRVPSRRQGSAALAPLAWMAVLAAFVITVGLLPTAQDRVPSGQTSTIAVRVSKADTLWSIAAAHRLPGVSTARMVELISEASALTPGAVRAGAIVRVPVEPAADMSYAQAEPSGAAN